MKSTKIKKSVSMLLAVLTFISVFAVSANAEELLPEACGGATYNEDAIAAASDETAADEAVAAITGETESEAAVNEDEPVTAAEPAEADESIVPPEAEIEAVSESAITAEATENTDGTETAEKSIELSAAEESDSAMATEEKSGNEIKADAGVVAVVEAKVVPHPHTREPEEDAVRDRNVDISRKVGDVIIKVGESLLPFGKSISDFMKSRSNQGKDMDNVETAIDLAADSASFMCPVGAPLVSVAKDIVLKIWHLF